MSDAPVLSVVIPVRNEAEAIPALAAEVHTALAGAGLTWEALWVDDGSTDTTRQHLVALPLPHRALILDRNYGKSAAIIAGLHSARGTWIATLDGDGQDDPADLPGLLNHAQAHGIDLVQGRRIHRRDTWWRRFCSSSANTLRRQILHDGIHDIGCGTRVGRRNHLVLLPSFTGMHRFLPSLVRAQGGTVAELPVNHRPRHGGTSKYGTHDRLWCGLYDLLCVRWVCARSLPIPALVNP